MCLVMVFELQKGVGHDPLLGGLANEGALLLGACGRGLAARLGREAWPGAAGGGDATCCPRGGHCARTRVCGGKFVGGRREKAASAKRERLAVAPSHTHQSRTFFAAFFHLTL